MSTKAPFVIIENAKVSRGRLGGGLRVHPVLDPHGILSPVAVLPDVKTVGGHSRGLRPTLAVSVRLLVALDYPGRVSA